MLVEPALIVGAGEGRAEEEDKTSLGDCVQGSAQLFNGQLILHSRLQRVQKVVGQYPALFVVVEALDVGVMS